eukprot:CAMPEP_0203675212 /NCGR_PEP_ID=MMETSP0090-20130426/19542_1 /ASSEMBLY_ACC=CAM_ASM_001088 /TAXON_ID=426623 /ORGANISM="Chaetoceros affinis, Strain CCMP159" /LENGTH=412 /DNA_ID=CAMNT_0050541337 /DNA_START=118 /DNA_END=1353 /DNA_ORIENTATION=-
MIYGNKHKYNDRLFAQRSGLQVLLQPPQAVVQGWTKLSAVGRQRRFSTSHDNDDDDNNDDGDKVPLTPPIDLLTRREEEARHRRTGQAKQRLEKSVRREERISILEEKANANAKERDEQQQQQQDYLTKAEMAELQGLLKVREHFEEQYDPVSFTKEHLDFKSMHNDVLIALTRYCEKERATIICCDDDEEEQEQEQESSTNKPTSTAAATTNIFFLDGPDGGTATALIDRGNFHPQQCFVANRHISTCDKLREMLPEMNIVHATAAEALTVGVPLHFDDDNDNDDDADELKNANQREDGGAFSDIDFTSYYFDGCGGFTGHIINMISAALIRDNCDDDGRNRKPIAVGYSLLGGNKDVVSKELLVSRALSTIARRRGMRMAHALDDPSKYGISLDTMKIGGSGGGGTFTTW